VATREFQKSEPGTGIEGDAHFDDHFVRSQHAVYAFIVSQLPNRFDADDVFQQTNLVLLKKRACYDASQPFLGWAFGIARNEVRNFVRKSRREKTVLSEAVLDLLAQTHAMHADFLHEQLDRLQDCLGRLDQQLRSIVCETYSGMSAKTIARSLGITRDAVYKRLERARKSLFECVTRQGTQP
jgi:RNA polymerase sigma-70 factor (ECF subfamily)